MNTTWPTSISDLDLICDWTIGSRSKVKTRSNLSIYKRACQLEQRMHGSCIISSFVQLILLFSFFLKNHPILNKHSEGLKAKFILFLLDQMSPFIWFKGFLYLQVPTPPVPLFTLRICM